MSELSVEIEVEEFPLEYPGVVPVMMDMEEGQLYFEIYEGLEKDIEVFIEEYRGRYFSIEAFEFLCNAVDSYLEDKSYLRDQYGRTRFYRKFILTNPKEVNKEFIKENSVMMSEELKKLPNMTSLFADDTGEIPPLSFVTVQEGRIVSVATVNDTSSDTVREITVNTAPKYRGRGFGASNTAALSKYLTEKGYTVAYCVSNYNKQSVRIAKKCGFEEVGKFYAVSAYRTNSKEEN